MIIALVVTAAVIIAALLAMMIYFRSQMSRMAKEQEQQFRILAAETLDRNARTLQQNSAEQLTGLLNPLKMRIEDFNREMERNHTDAESSRRSLSDQIDRLSAINRTIGDEARNLASALRGNNRLQGQWGETVLEKLLERAGLKKGVHFETQVTRDTSGRTLRNDDDSYLRPDLIIFLPDNRNVIVDAKTSLSAYLDYCDAPTAEEATEALRRHIISVKKHIDELSSKNYSKSISDSAEQVLMFIPNDGALIAAIDGDENLITYGLDRKIVLVSPSQIMGVVMLVTQMWRKEAQDRNALEIARLGGLLYDSAQEFLSDLQNIEKALNTAHKSYDSAVSRLSQGTRSFMQRAQKLRELGVRTKR